MNVFLRELKANRKSLIIWSICMIMFIAMGMQKYEALVGSGASIEQFTKMLDSMPKVLQTMWGVSDVDLTKPIGYFSVLFPYILLICSIHAGMLGANIISKEERDKTVEFLMVKPVSRNVIVTSKMLAALLNILIVNISTYIPSILIITKMTNEFNPESFILAAIATFMIQLLFLVIGAGISTISKNYKKAGSLTVGILLGTYFISLVTDISDKLNFLSIVTPFKWFDAKIFMNTNKLNNLYIILICILTIAMSIISYNRYSKRDLNC